jgi:CRISPR-associated protein Cmr6
LIKQTIVVATEWMRLRFPMAEIPVPGVAVALPAAVIPVENRPVLRVPPVLRRDRGAIGAGAAVAWRERWMASNVRVFCCVSQQDKSLVIPWLHGTSAGQNGAGGQALKVGDRRRPAPVAANTAAWARPAAKPGGGGDPKIARSVVTGMMQDKDKTPQGPTQIGRLWHRMYPLPGGDFLEMVTVFYGGCEKAQEFTEFLKSHSKFQELKF